MDKVKKIIHLEESKNRTPNMLPYYMFDLSANTCTLHYDDNTWGGYCVDILIPKTQNKCLPLLRWAFDLSSIYHFQEVEVVGGEVINGNIPSGCTCQPESITAAYWVRYKNLMMLYHWLLNKFIPSIVFYIKCNNEFKPVDVNDADSIFGTNTPIYDNLNSIDDETNLEHYKYIYPNKLAIKDAGEVNENTLKLFYYTAKVVGNVLYLENGVQDGEIVAVTPLYDDLIKQFKSVDTVKNFLSFINKLLNEGLFYPLSGTTPYIDVDFSISSSNVDLGFMSPLIETWVPKKKYYLGENVLYNNQQYQLCKCPSNCYDKYELTGLLLDEILESIENEDEHYLLVNDEDLIPNECFDLSLSQIVSNKTGEKISYVYCILQQTNSETGLDSYFLIQPYYNGTYIRGLYCFDDASEHWQKRITNKNYCSFFRVEENDEIRDVFQCSPMTNGLPEITGITESNLITLKRKITSVDDFGNVLPFIINNESNYGDLFYNIGITNEVKYNDCWRADELTQIRYKEKNGEYTSATTITTQGSISSDSFIYNEGIIEFTYFIGCQLESELVNNDLVLILPKTRIDYTGVKYVEEWYYKKEMKSVRIDGNDITCFYINIYPKENTNYALNNVDINGKKPIYSIVTYYGKESMNNNEMNVHYYKDEDLLGIYDVNNLNYDMQYNKYVNGIDCYIERSIATAFERHNILGEVKSFADLENYRNNFFNL